MAISKQEKEQFTREAVTTVTSLILLFKLDPLDDDLRKAMTEAYIAGGENIIKHMQGKMEKAKLIEPDDIPF